MIRVVQFAGCINRYDFIDNIVQHVDPQRFSIGVVLGSDHCNIEVPVYPKHIPRWFVPWKPRRELMGPARRLARILRDWKADILHTHHYDEALIGWLATRLHRPTKLVIGRHYSDQFAYLPSRLKRTVLLAAERVVHRAATRIIVPSSSIREMLTQPHGVGGSKVDHVPYAFVAAKYAAPQSASRAEMRRELDVENRFVIGTFGRLIDLKGHRFLIEAMALLRARVPQARLLIVGEGVARANLERMIHDLGLGDVVRLVGWRPDAMAVMAAVDVVVQPSLTEAFSQTMVEALWMSRPLVMTDVSGVRDVIRNGENGLIVPPSDKHALDTAISRLAADKNLRESMASAGRAYVERHLSIASIIPRYERAYMRALGIGED